MGLEFKNHPTATWVKTIKAIHGSNGGLEIGQNNIKVDGQGPWQNVRAAINVLSNLGFSLDDLCLK